MAVLTRPEPATYRAVFAAGEFRALWAAQVISFAGDQFAKVALALLVYGRTGSPALAAVTFASGTVAEFAGGLLLGWVADRFPRRAVMITCDVACAGLVLAMIIPGVPLAVLVVLLVAVSLATQPFLAARMATNRKALGPGLFPLGNAITIGTYQVAQLAGFAAAGVVAAAAGTRVALLIDAGSFAVSAVIVRLGVTARPAPDDRPSGPGRPHLLAGTRLVFASPGARAALLLMWLAAFFAVPEGVAVPLGRQFGGPAVVGWLLAATAAGAAAGALGYARLLGGGRAARFAAVSAAGACAALALFAFQPRLAGALAILAGSGLCTGYIATAGGALMNMIPDEHRGKVSGVIGAGMSLGQGVAVVAAGAAAQRFSPALVVAGAGVAGSVAAALLARGWRRAVVSGAYRPGPPAA